MLLLADELEDREEAVAREVSFTAAAARFACATLPLLDRRAAAAGGGALAATSEANRCTILFIFLSICFRYSASEALHELKI